MDREISPPPAKRRKLIQESSSTGLDSPSPEIPGPPDPNTMHIFSWNINRISHFLQKSITSFLKTSPKSSATREGMPQASLRDFLRRHHWPAVLLLQEVKIATKDTKTQNAVCAAINASSSTGNTEPQYEAHFTLPADPHNARGPRGSGKVYGVCSIVRRNLREKYQVNFRTVNWDNEGRISVVELKTDAENLAVFNIYAVNGTDNPYRDPETGVQRGTRHDRKLAFHKALADEAQVLEEGGWNVLLGGDMNVAPDTRDGHPKLRTFPRQHSINRADFHDKLLESGEDGKRFHGVDVWRKMHAEERRYTYYPRGREWGTSCDRVDYFIAGKKAWDSGIVKDCGILNSEEERGPSDHVPIWVDIAFQSESKEEEVTPK
ncbi:hypothetical protein OPT61_g7540 [Boeremia exigua]|uniref:Uncharacterized protein n=1 Tax=Boeremia exigua TaxID=749465 RepID=A0ACC2I1U5_9PLEO|nr:hypothetical protein OPT61_g7540 [Boeremia exigua]